MKKVAVLVSGGVDSSLALVLLKNQGYDVTAFYLKIWLEDELSFLGNCPWEEDLSFVRQLCDQFAVPLQIINLQKEYFSLVIDLALNQIQKGLTPNPDIFCNSLVKFGVFFNHLSKDFDFIATGHYARIVRNNEKAYLAISPDSIKDQTYFLSKLSQSQLQKALFPIGELCKNQVRSLAQAYNLPSKNRKDSQGLCFLGKIKFDDFIRENIGEKEGNIVEVETGKILGKHKGFWFFTIGQRKGLGLSGGPWYIVSKDARQNIVFVSNNYFDPEKKRESMIISEIHWISSIPENLENLKVKLRHGEIFYNCRLDCSDPENIILKLINSKDQGISPGQFVVFYQNNICLGSAMILEDLNNKSYLV